MSLECVNDKESLNLEQFRAIVQDLGEDDGTLLRFLRARNGDIKKAEDMLRKSVAWRKENNVSSYVKWRPAQPVADDFVFEYTGKDHDGNAVLYVPVGRWCIREMIEKGLSSDCFLFRFHLLETMMEYTKKCQKNQFTIVIDIAELTYRKCAHVETIQVVLAAFRDFEANYPERLKAAFIINTHWVFQYIYAFVKPLLSGHTLSKVRIFDCDETKWKPILLEYIPEDALKAIPPLTIPN